MDLEDLNEFLTPDEKIDRMVERIAEGIKAKKRTTPLFHPAGPQVLLPPLPPIPSLRDDLEVARIILAGAESCGIRFVENEMGGISFLPIKGVKVSLGVKHLILAFRVPIEKLLQQEKKSIVKAVEDYLRPS